MIKPKVVEGCRVPKGWGEEIIIENNENYCGKILVFEPECKFSMHYHICLLYTSPSPRDVEESRMPSSA